MAVRYGARLGGGRPGVFNLFDVPPWNLPLHALPARLIAYFIRAYDHVSKIALERSERAITEFSSWGYPPSLVREVLLALLRGGMLRSPELTQVAAEEAIALPFRLVVTASGHAHLTRILPMNWYRALTGIHMRWYDEEPLKTFVKQCCEAGGHRGVTVGDVVASGAVSSLDAYLASCLVREDAMLASAFERHDWVRAVRSRAYMFEHDLSHPYVAGNEQPPLTAPTPTRTPDGQLFLLPNDRPRTTDTPMPSLSLDQAHMEPVWIPRILWALMHAERTQSGPLTAADIDRRLTEHVAINVHAPNVARAFRELKGKYDLWICKGRRYSLTDPGRRAFAAIFHEFETRTAVANDSDVAATNTSSAQ